MVVVVNVALKVNSYLPTKWEKWYFSARDYRCPLRRHAEFGQAVNLKSRKDAFRMC